MWARAPMWNIEQDSTLALLYNYNHVWHCLIHPFIRILPHATTHINNANLWHRSGCNRRATCLRLPPPWHRLAVERIEARRVARDARWSRFTDHSVTVTIHHSVKCGMLRFQNDDIANRNYETENTSRQMGHQCKRCPNQAKPSQHNQLNSIQCESNHIKSGQLFVVHNGSIFFILRNRTIGWSIRGSFIIGWYMTIIIMFFFCSLKKNILVTPQRGRLELTVTLEWSDLLTYNLTFGNTLCNHFFRFKEFFCYW